jgi:hypothetical protein
MPNWCYNAVTLSNTDKTKIDELESVLSDDKAEIFMHLCPRPADQEEEWYAWNVNNWGTKWDVTPHDWDRDGDNTITMNFDSAWSPPLALYEHLESNGWEVRAYYHEPGMGFAGRFEDGHDDYYELDWTDRESVENLPEDILDFSNALEDLENYEQEQLEESLVELERTEWYPISVAPVKDGRYEVTTKAWPYPQYCDYTDGNWGRWDGDELEVVQWRGLTKEYIETEMD